MFILRLGTHFTFIFFYSPTYAHGPVTLRNKRLAASVDDVARTTEPKSQEIKLR